MPCFNLHSLLNAAWDFKLLISLQQVYKYLKLLDKSCEFILPCFTKYCDCLSKYWIFWNNLFVCLTPSHFMAENAWRGSLLAAISIPCQLKQVAHLQQQGSGQGSNQMTAVYHQSLSSDSYVCDVELITWGPHFLCALAGSHSTALSSAFMNGFDGTRLLAYSVTASPHCYYTRTALTGEQKAEWTWAAANSGKDNLGNYLILPFFGGYFVCCFLAYKMWSATNKAGWDTTSPDTWFQNHRLWTLQTGE